MAYEWKCFKLLKLTYPHSEKYDFDQIKGAEEKIY